MNSNLNTKILLAGYTGLVGSAILANLQKKGYNNIIKKDIQDLDFRRQSEVEALFHKEKPEYVILAAAKVGGIVANNTYKAEFIYDNIAIAMNVINSAHKYNVKKLLNLGSSCIYPKMAPQPIKEEFLLTGELEQTNEPYAIAKISAIKLCRYFNEQFGTNFISVMPTNLYGKRDNYNLETSHVIPALIRKFILAKALFEKDFEFIIKDLKKYKLGFKLEDEIITEDKNTIINALKKAGITPDSVTIWGTGKVMREFLHIDDMAEACIYIMENYNFSDIGEFVNIGIGTDLTIRDLAELIKKITGFSGKIVFDSSKPDGTPRKLLDVSRINNLGWKAKISLEEGINRLYKEYNDF